MRIIIAEVGNRFLQILDLEYQVQLDSLQHHHDRMTSALDVARREELARQADEAAREQTRRGAAEAAARRKEEERRRRQEEREQRLQVRRSLFSHWNLVSFVHGTSNGGTGHAWITRFLFSVYTVLKPLPHTLSGPSKGNSEPHSVHPRKSEDTRPWDQGEKEAEAENGNFSGRCFGLVSRCSIHLVKILFGSWKGSNCEFLNVLRAAR